MMDVQKNLKTLRDLKCEMIKVSSLAKEGHLPSAFSILDILWVLYDKVLNVDPKNPQDPERDYFILSKGHASLGLYSVLAEKGFFLTSKEGATPDQVAFSDVLANTLQALIVEIQKTIADAKAEHKVQFEKGIIFGGLSHMINLGAYLTLHLNVPCNTLNPLSLLESIDVASTIEVEKGSAVAIGLAIEGLRKPRFPAVNFRKGDFSKQGQNFKLIWQNNKPVILGLAAIYVLLFVYSIVRTDLATSNLEAVDAATKSLAKSPVLAGAVNIKAGVIKNFIKDKKKSIFLYLL